MFRAAPEIIYRSRHTSRYDEIVSRIVNVPHHRNHGESLQSDSQLDLLNHFLLRLFVIAALEETQHIVPYLLQHDAATDRFAVLRQTIPQDRSLGVKFLRLRIIPVGSVSVPLK